MLRATAALVHLLILVVGMCGCTGCAPRSWEGAGGPTLRVLLTSDPIAEVRLSASGPYGLFVDGRRVQGGESLRTVAVRREGPLWRFGSQRLRGRTLRLTGAAPARVRLDKTAYRGELRLLPAGDDRFIVINHVDTESYVAGVIAKELYEDWSLETYRAQAVAARTYALYKQAFSAGKSYDLVAGTADQVYGGSSGETRKSRRAVQDTRGWVLAWGQEGHERIFLAQYSACNGGVVNPASVIRPAAKIPPLGGGQRDADGRLCPRYRWGPVRLRKTAIYQAVLQNYPEAKELEGLAGIRVAEQTTYHRPVWLDLLGASGERIRLRAEDLRLALLRNGPKAARKLYSMNCRMRDLGDGIEFYRGRGYGHGVGLSQWGAEDKARRGWTARRILAFYYPEAKIFRAY